MRITDFLACHRRLAKVLRMVFSLNHPSRAGAAASRCLPLLACGLLLLPTALKADVRLPSLISDNMVLQQKGHATLWGEADPAEKISVKLGAFPQVSTTASADGHWAIKLPPLRPGGPYDMTISGRTQKTVIHNVAVGEVWVCSGQSNMEWPVSLSQNAKEEITAADHPMIRIFTVAKKTSDKQESSCEGHWVVCDPSATGTFPAVAYYFGRDLNKTLKVPVGLINSSSGASTIEQWIPKDGFDLDPDLKSIATGQTPDATATREEYKRRYQEWVQAAETAKANNQAPPPEPAAPKGGPSGEPPSALFNGMISPLLPYSMRGVVWYQGESNTRNPQLYRKLFPALIRSWRQAWGGSDFPFLYVQLPNFLLPKSFPSGSAWAELREAQAMALKVPKTAMVVTIDIGDHTLHPPDKQDVGHRLAQAALAGVYEEDSASPFGPVFTSSKIAGNNVTLTFKQIGGGLITKDGGSVKGFAVAGADKKFYWADAKIEGDKVTVHSDQVAQPVAVRYAWADNPDCNLCNKAGLPAAPFRTDNW